LDGIPIFCRDAENLLQTGAADFEQPTVVWDEGWIFVKFNRETEAYETQTTINRPTAWGPEVVESVTVTKRIESETEALFGMFAFRTSRTLDQSKKKPATQPQNSQPAPDAIGIREDVKRRLENPDCANFLKKLIALVSSANPANPLVKDGNLLEIFDQINTPPNGGLVRAGHPGSDLTGGSQANGSFATNNAQIQFGTFIPIPSNSAEINRSDGQTALDELMHHAGQYRYFDYDYAKVMSENGMGELPESTDPYGKDRFKFSRYLHDRIHDKCK
jgi:hypothetical protein